MGEICSTPSVAFVPPPAATNGGEAIGRECGLIHMIFDGRQCRQLLIRFVFIELLIMVQVECSFQQHGVTTRQRDNMAAFNFLFLLHYPSFLPLSPNASFHADLTWSFAAAPLDSEEY